MLVSETMCYEAGCRYLFHSFAYDFSAVEHTIAAYVQDPKYILRKLNAIYFKVTPEIRRKLQEISVAQRETSMFGMLRVEACLQELLWLCVDVATNDRMISRMHQDDAFILQRIKSGIDADPGKAEKLDHMAREYGISISKLSRCFKETYGMPLHAYVIESRLCEGARLLAEGKLTIGEISERVGYAKQSQFAAAFRRCFPMKKGIFITSLLSSLIAIGALTACAETNSTFAGGDGSAEDPWQIATAEQMDLIRNDLSGHYELIEDIDLSGFENWEPIGAFQSLSDAPEDAEVPHPDYAFTGTFDGNGHTISNLTAASENPMGAGLFGCASGTDEGAAFIRNFVLENVNVSGGYLVGGAVGLQFMNCSVSDITLTGTNTLTGMQGIGGVVGTGFDLIENCTATADITVLGDDGACAGIIAGGTTMSSVKNCRAVDGSITAEGNATWGFGALCGAPWGAPEITDCEAVGTKITVSGEGNRLVGGLVGFGGSYDETAPMQSLLIVMEAWRLVRKQLRLHEGLGHFIMCVPWGSVVLLLVSGI